MSDKPYSCGLVVEGGALRGIHTAGVMDVLMRYNIYFPYVIGVSAGALNSYNYISRQSGRSAKILLDYIRDDRYLNLRSIPNQKQSAFGFDFMFYGLQDVLPFDFDTFNDPSVMFTVVATDVTDGSPVYFRKGECSDIFRAGAASASLPLVSPPVELDGHRCIDGGVADPIPFLKAMEECDKVVVLLTRHKGFRKRTMPFAERETAKRLYKSSPEMLEAALSANDRYNDTLDLLEQLEEEGRIFVVRPSKEIDISLLERNTISLGALYREGLADGESVLRDLTEYIGFTNGLLQFDRDGSVRKSNYDISGYTSAEGLEELVRKAAQSTPRITGNAAHTHLLDEISRQIGRLGLPVYADPYYFTSRTPTGSIFSVKQLDQTVQFPSRPIPYTGCTGDEPVFGELCAVKDKNYRFIGARGKIAVVHLDSAALHGNTGYEVVSSVPNDAALPEHFGTLDYLSAFSFLRLAKLAGVKGLVCVWDESDTVPDRFFPYAQYYVDIPCVWVGADTGRQLTGMFAAGQPLFANLVVQGDVEAHASTRTLYTILPGEQTDESVLICAHTEGVNAVEENGFAALLSLLRCLRYKPLRRTYIFVFVSGQYRLSMVRSGSVGSTGAVQKWLKMHPDLWDGKDGHLNAVAAIVPERLGWRDMPDIVFSSNASLDAMFESARSPQADPHLVVRAYSGIFGTGQPLHAAGVPVLAFAADAPASWDPLPDDVFDGGRMLRQLQTILNCISRMEEIPRESIGQADRAPLSSVLPFSAGSSARSKRAESEEGDKE